jgi:hypothetical protein
MHSVTVEFDFVQPLRPIGRLVDQLGELRFDPTGERRRLGAPPSAERSRHVFRHDSLASADRSRPDLSVDLPHDFRPPVDDWQHRGRLLRREHWHDARDTHVGEALHPVEILAEAERGDFDGIRIAAGLLRHLAEFRQDLGNIAARRPRLSGLL